MKRKQGRPDSNESLDQVSSGFLNNIIEEQCVLISLSSGKFSKTEVKS